jgi:hypothetical protein
MFMGSEGTVAYHCDNNYNVKLRHYNLPLWQQLEYEVKAL